MTYLDPSDEIRKHGPKLPHWQQGDAMQFVTFRLADSMPAAKLRQWKEELQTWQKVHPKPWTPKQEIEYHQRFTWKLEGWLDEGCGSCLLKDPTNRACMEESLMCFQGEKVEHHSWVIMPNHLHLIFTPLAPLEKLIQAWKGVSARRAVFDQIVPLALAYERSILSVLADGEQRQLLAILDKLEAAELALKPHIE